MTFDQRLTDMRLQMTVYGAGLGLVGGGLLGAGFIALIYNPFQDMNILLILVGTLATMLVGLVFGLISGGIAGVCVSVLTTLFFKQVRFRWLYTILAASITMTITTMIFFQTAYLVGRPYVYDPDLNQSWVWALMVAVIGALIASNITTHNYLTTLHIKTKIR